MAYELGRLFGGILGTGLIVLILFVTAYLVVNLSRIRFSNGRRHRHRRECTDSKKIKTTEPNKALEPTTIAVTSPAAQEPRQP